MQIVTDVTIAIDGQNVTLSVTKQAVQTDKGTLISTTDPVVTDTTIEIPGGA